MTIMPLAIHIFIIMDFELYIAVPPNSGFVTSAITSMCGILLQGHFLVKHFVIKFIIFRLSAQIHDHLGKYLRADQKVLQRRELIGTVHAVVRPRHGGAEATPFFSSWT